MTNSVGASINRYHVSPVGAVVRGVLAGVVGTAAMDALLYGRYRRGGGKTHLAAWEFTSDGASWDDAPAPAQVGKRLVEGVFERTIPLERVSLVNNITHWGYGALGGAPYGLLAGSMRHPRVGYGLPFGASVWAASYVVLPAAKLYKPIWDYDRGTLAKDLSAHLVYGFVAAVTYRLLPGHEVGALVTRRVADDLLEVLIQAGVQRIYGLVGDSLNAFSDAVRRSGGSANGGVDWVHVHNEEAAAFAASADAQLTGRLAVCAGSCGPGNTHLIQGVMDAHRSGAPVLALATQISSTQIGTGYFQETKPEALFAQTSHYCESITQRDQAVRLTRLAIQNAVGKQGVAVLVAPGDILAEHSNEQVGHSATVQHRPLLAPDDDAVAELVGRLSSAASIAIFAGIGCANARAEVLELAGLLNAPIGHTLRGKDVMQYDNPFDVGMTGLLGYGSCYRALHDADLVLFLGTDFPYDDFLPTSNNIQVDIDPARLGRRAPIVQGIAADVGETMRALLPRLEQRADRSFLDEMLRAHHRAVRHGVETYNTHVSRRPPIHPEYLVSVIDEFAAADAIMTVDTGMCCTWAARYITPNGRRRLIGSFAHGSMANALPMAIGAQTSHPNRQIVSMSGDGGLAMLLGELLTVKTHNLPIKVVVFNNSSLDMVRLEMLVAGDPPFETDHDNVDYAALARAAGFESRRVTEPGDLRDAARAVFGYDGPALLDVVTTPDALEVPTHLTVEEAKGFALSVGKIVLGGGVGELANVARLNVRNIPRP